MRITKLGCMTDMKNEGGFRMHIRFVTPRGTNFAVYTQINQTLLQTIFTNKSAIMKWGHPL